MRRDEHLSMSRSRLPLVWSMADMISLPSTARVSHSKSSAFCRVILINHSDIIDGEQEE
jgi:hypothetical protein